MAECTHCSCLLQCMVVKSGRQDCPGAYGINYWTHPNLDSKCPGSRAAVHSARVYLTPQYGPCPAQVDFRNAITALERKDLECGERTSWELFHYVTHQSTPPGSTSTTHPGPVPAQADFRNAFNSIRRDKMLEAARENIPELFHYVFSCYSSPSSLFLLGTTLQSAEGV